MLCKADFEEIFPELFKPNRRSLANAPTETVGPTCIARWEDDGGRPCDRMRRRDAPTGATADGDYPVGEPMRKNIALATLPVAAAYVATWTMLASLGGTVKI